MLEATGMGKTGDLLVLKMVEHGRIVDLVEDLIRHLGSSPVKISRSRSRVSDPARN